jgi:hypothetical protein
VCVCRQIRFHYEARYTGLECPVGRRESTVETVHYNEQYQQLHIL